MRLIDYKLKVEVMSSPMFQDYKKANKILYKYYSNGLDIQTDEYKNALSLLEEIEKSNPDFYKECKRVWNAHSKKANRLKRYITDMLNVSSCIFLTFTFSEDSMKRLKSDVRRKYVTQYLSKHSDDYCANIDFGNDHIYIDNFGNPRQATEREHYHAVIRCDKVDYSLWHKFGAIVGERIRVTYNKETGELQDSGKLGQYIAKLTNHAIKKSAQRSSLIYSRKTSKELKEYYSKCDFSYSLENHSKAPRLKSAKFKKILTPIGYISDVNCPFD